MAVRRCCLSSQHEGPAHGCSGVAEGLGLERYEAAFRDNEIDWQVLPSLTADDLKEIGIAAVRHRPD